MNNFCQLASNGQRNVAKQNKNPTNFRFNIKVLHKNQSKARTSTVQSATEIYFRALQDLNTKYANLFTADNRQNTVKWILDFKQSWFQIIFVKIMIAKHTEI